jgi:elongator complex protein 6
MTTDKSFSHQGLDLDSMGRAGRFSFVDGLTGLLSGGRGSESTADRGRVLLSGKPDAVRRSLEAAIADVRSSGPKILIIDQLDELLAIFGDEDVTGPALEGMLLSLREVSFSAQSYRQSSLLLCRLTTLLLRKRNCITLTCHNQRVHATVLSFSVDDALLRSQGTTLERSHAALVLAQAHAADVILSLRMLDTGVAKDVSGVVRVTERDRAEAGAEYLYHVGADGNVKVFERGA